MINKRGGKKDAHIDATHYGGSQSFYDRAMSNAAKNKGKMPTVPELFYETHTKERAKGKRVWNSKKNANLYAKFRLRKERNPDISDNELWLDLVDGFNKGGVYGTGTARELLYDRPTSVTPQSQTYMPSIVSQLQTTLETEREERKAAREAREAARDEELKRMKEQMELMTTYFSSCNPG
ncbi:uncharacterized protein LOC141654851 [Silene latifolia]|uniref:uncharacterized protein LOC141654851 n=1 Tax=Silene latifolia TaxID=37657 RepID=UPI003D77BE20